MAVRLTRQSVQVAAQGEAVRLTRLSVQVAAQPPAPENVRLTRLAVQVAAQPPSTVRLTRLAVQVAISSFTDDVVRGPRRAGVILQRHQNTIDRG